MNAWPISHLLVDVWGILTSVVAPRVGIMTSQSGTRVRTRGLRIIWDITLFATGWLITTLALFNLPGAETAAGVTDLGVLVWLLSTLAWVSVFFRRGHPAVVIGAGLVLAFTGTEYLLLLIGVHHAAMAWAARTRLWLGVGATGVVALFWVRELFTAWGDRMVLTVESAPDNAAIVSGIIAAASLAVTVALSLLSSSRRAADTQRARADAEHSHTTRLEQQLAFQEERSQIAREIHDGLTNRLALVSMMGSNVERAVRGGDADAAHLARDLQTEARYALVDLRALVGDLRTEPNEPPPRKASMRSLGDLISATRAAGTTVDAIIILDGAAEAPAELDGAVFRLVQEALTNAIKHAPTTTIALYLDASPGSGVRLRVANAVEHANSSGGGANASAGSGLAGMRERVAALQGTAWAGEHLGEFIIDITLPWHPTTATSSGPPHTTPAALGGNP